MNDISLGGNDFGTARVSIEEGGAEFVVIDLFEADGVISALHKEHDNGTRAILDGVRDYLAGKGLQVTIGQALLFMNRVNKAVAEILKKNHLLESASSPSSTESTPSD